MKVELQGIQALLQRMANLQKFQPLKKLLGDAALIAQREARQQAPQDTRTLARSIAIDVQLFMARVYTQLAYAPVMEYGRRAGAKPPPPEALAGWARRHHFGGSLFVLARAIGRRGIKGRFFMKKAEAAMRQSIPRLTSEMEKRIESDWQAGR